MIEQLELLRGEYGTANLVVWGAFIVGALFGFIAEYSRYCARAALAEWAPGNERKDAASNRYARTKQYLAAVLVALAGTQVLFFFQNIDLAQSIYWSVPIRPLALIAGGVMFGVGMVLAGGCVSRLLVLAATGNGRSIIALLVTGLAGYATLRGILSYPRIWLENAWTLESAPAQIYQAGTVSHMTVAVAIAIILLAAMGFVVRKHGTTGLISGALIGSLVVAAWAVTGIVGADDFEPSPLASLSFVAPAGETLQFLMIYTGDTIRFSIALLLGVLAGAFISALMGGRLRYRGFATEGSLVKYITAEVLMGFGGVTALGCSVGQALSDVSSASISSVIAVLGIAAGGYSAMLWQARVENSSLGSRLFPAE